MEHITRPRRDRHSCTEAAREGSGEQSVTRLAITHPGADVGQPDSGLCEGVGQGKEQWEGSQWSALGPALAP